MRIKIDPQTGCWNWHGTLNNQGYGRITIRSERYLAHRLSYELFNSPLLAGMTLDHLCRNPRCVNPFHLEEVTMRENVLRGEGPTAINARKTHCDHGHEFTPRNTYLTPRNNYRNCRRCKADRERERQRKIRANAKLAAEPTPTEG